MKKTLGVLIVGTGWAANEHISAYNANPYTEIRGLCNIHPKKAETAKARFGLDCPVSNEYRTLLASDDIDIVSICTPHNAHFEQAKDALIAGKNVLVEKPLCLSFEQARILKKLTLETRLKTGVGFVARWYSAIKSLKKMVDTGAIGEPFYIESDYWHEVASGWKSAAETAGSSLLTGGVHAVDMMRYFQTSNVEAEEVFAYALSPRRRFDFTYDPTMAMIIRFSNGSIGKIGCSLELTMPYVFHLQVLGTTGAIRGPRIYSEALLGEQAFMRVPGVYPDNPDVGHHPFDEEIDHFIDSIINDFEPMISILDAYKTHEIVFAAEHSAKTGKPVRLPLSEDQLQ
jgi:predicted dehydrogenase